MCILFHRLRSNPPLKTSMIVNRHFHIIHIIHIIIRVSDTAHPGMRMTQSMRDGVALIYYTYILF